MPQVNDLSRCLAALDQDIMLIAVIEMSPVEPRPRRSPHGIWECAACGKQTSVTAGTIMHHCKLPLITWFWAAHLMATHSNPPERQRRTRASGLLAACPPGCGPRGNRFEGFGQSR